MSCDTFESQKMDAVYVACNTAHYATWFELPALPAHYGWKLHFNTGAQQSTHFADPIVFENHGILVGERSVVIFAASHLET